MFLRYRDTIFYFIYAPSLASEVALCLNIYSYTQQARKFVCFYNLIFFFLWPNHMACRILIPWPRFEPVPLAWKDGVLTTGSPGKSAGQIWQKQIQYEGP